MIYPKKVPIGGKVIKVTIDAQMESWGEYHAEKGEIRLAARCLENIKALTETLRHEILHAALDISGLSYIKNFEEEALVRCIDTIFFPAWDTVAKQIKP